MGYSVKWVAENLGVTRDMLRYYEKEKLLPIDETRNPSNKYRDYSEEDIKRIWNIKLFIGIGFTAKEIRAFGENPNFSFYEAIAGKVKQLEDKQKDLLTCLQFAKTIKMTGRIPTTTTIGNVSFDDFIEFSHQHWNAFNDPEYQQPMALMDTLLEKTKTELDESVIQKIFDLFGNMEPEQIAEAQTISGYYRVIVDMTPLGYDSDLVQQIINCLYKHTLNSIEHQYQAEFTPLYFADRAISSFVESGFAELNKRVYGKDGCMFIARALAYFGGYDLENQ